MIKRYSGPRSLTILVVTFMVLCPHAYADRATDTMQFNNFIQVTHAYRAQMEARLGIDPHANTYPQASSYYDDLVDHYEQDQLMRDVIDKGIDYTPR